MSHRVLFVDEDQERNGSTVSLEYLTDGFAAEGFEVLVLTWKGDPRFADGLRRHARLIDGRRFGIRNVALSVHFSFTEPLWSWWGIRTFVKDVAKFLGGFAIALGAIRKTRPDLVYVNEYSAVQAALAARVCGIPAVTHVRSQMLSGTFGVRRYLLRLLLFACNQALFAITKREAGQLRADKGGKVRVIGEFFPTRSGGSLNGGAFREACRIPKGNRLIATLGGIYTLKGTMDFLRAAFLVSGRHNDVVFAVAGKQYRNGRHHREYYDACMRLAHPLQVNGALLFLGEIANPLELIAASDILVSPSTVSHFSRPVIEAWGLSKPVIAARLPHMEDLIKDGVSGLLYNPGDYEGLSRAMLRLLDDTRLADRVAQEGKKKCLAEFDAETNLRNIIETCGDYLHAHRH
ncbi:MAG: glycosyltransferase family 4 protein [Bacteroidota bacterium]